MSNEIEVTVRGFVGSRPRIIESRGKAPMLSVRVGSTPRRRDPATGAWGDGETIWLSAVAFGDLALNAAHSLRKGDPVLLRGRLAIRRTESDGRTFLDASVYADAIGHELTRGRTSYAQVERRDLDGAGDGVQDGPEVVVRPDGPEGAAPQAGPEVLAAPAAEEAVRAEDGPDSEDLARTA